MKRSFISLLSQAKKRKKKQANPQEEDEETMEYERARKKSKKRTGREETMDTSSTDETLVAANIENEDDKHSAEGAEKTGRSRLAKKRAKYRMRKKAKKKANKAKKEAGAEEEASPVIQIVKVLKSCGRFPHSWFFLNKTMLRDLYLAIYWGPTWLKKNPRLLNWFIHGGWAISFKKKEGKKDRKRKKKRSKQPALPEKHCEKIVDFESFNKKLRISMLKHWPQVKPQFWRHEWTKHCKEINREMNMTQEEYFSTVMDLFYAIKSDLNLEVGKPMPAKEAVAILQNGLGKVGMSAHREVAADRNGMLYIQHLKIQIHNKSYDIVSKRNQSSYLSEIETGDEIVVLADGPVTLEE
ncbi:hypothetical protein OROGR_016318 [Orobanche gracilis]